MSKLSDLPTYEYTVYALGADGLPDEAGPIEASYFQEQGSLLLFKDADHVAIEAFKLEHIVRVSRASEPLE